MRRLFTIFVFFLFLPSQVCEAVNWPLSLCGSGASAYLCDQDDVPFPVIADTAWSMAGELSPTEVATYLDDRAAKGFTAILMNAIEHAFSANAPNNYADEPPFTNGPSDWSVRNETYWSYLDYILNYAKSKNIVVFLTPSYIGYQCDSEGWGQQMLAQTTGAMTDYGEFLGNRYADQGNIIWVYGGDADCSDCSVCSRVTAIDTGIRTYDTNHLRTAHSSPSRSAMDDYNSIIDINTAYSYGSPDTEVSGEYQRSSAKPLTFVEGYYENEHSSTLGTWQSQAMIAHLGGAQIGQFFGNCPIWNFSASSASSFCDGGSSDWNDWLNSNGSTSMGHIASLIKSRAWWKLVPDYSNAVVTSSKGSGLSYRATARTSDGETIMVWCPNTNQITVDMSKITDSGSQVKAWWWDPDDNSSQLIGIYSTTGTRNFTPGSARMVLVLDNNDSGLSAPGSDVYEETNSTSSGGGGGGGGGCFVTTAAGD